MLNYHVVKSRLPALTIVFFIALFLIFFTANAFFNTAKESQQTVSWEYLWGDLSRDTGGSPDWKTVDQSDLDWKKAEDISKVSDRPEDANAAWFRTRLQTTGFRMPAAYFKMIYAQSLDIYIGDRHIFERKRTWIHDENRLIVPLSPEDNGKMLYIYTTGEPSRMRFGPVKSMLMGEYNDLQSLPFKEDFSSIILGGSFLLIGIGVLFCSLFLKKDLRRIWLSLSFVIFFIGIMITVYSPTLLMFFSAYEHLLIFSFDVALGGFVTCITYFLEQIFGAGYKSYIRRLWQGMGIYCLFVTAFELLNDLTHQSFAKVFYLFYIDIMGILMSILFLSLLITAAYHAVKGNTEARIMAGGFSLFAGSFAVELLIFLFFNPNYSFFLWEWGMLGFIISLISILGRRFSKSHDQLLAYSVELESKNGELAAAWEEIKLSKDQLADMNKTLEERVIERTQQLNKANEELSHMNMNLYNSNSELMTLMERLKAAQEQLVYSEKMAALGQLVASVAHEMNSPLGAIRSSTETVLRSLDKVLAQLPSFFQEIPEERQRDFTALLEKSLMNNEFISSNEERKYKKALVLQMEQNKITNAAGLAEMLVVMGIYDIQPFMPMLSAQESSRMVEMAFTLSGVKRNVRTIKESAERTSKVVFALRTYAHFDNAGEMVEADIREGIETVLMLFNNKIKYHVEVVKKYREISPVICNPDNLNQVWINIIQNALQAMEYKGILEIEVSQDQEYTVVSITDSGPGIPEEIKTRIFDPFFTTKLPGEGSGLGLDIVKKIVDKHHGKINVESNPGRTTFSIYILTKLPTES